MEQLINSRVNKDEAMSNILECIDNLHRLGEHIKNTKDYSKVDEIDVITSLIRKQIRQTDLTEYINKSDSGWSEEDFENTANGWAQYNFDSHADVFDSEINTYDNAVNL